MESGEEGGGGEDDLYPSPLKALPQLGKWEEEGRRGGGRVAAGADAPLQHTYMAMDLYTASVLGLYMNALCNNWDGIFYLAGPRNYFLLR